MSKTNSRHQARRLVMQALYQQHFTSDDYIELAKQFVNDEPRFPTDFDYFQLLLRQVIDNQQQIDAAFSPLLDRKIDDLNPVELAILRLSTAEFCFHQDIPYKVVINEALELAKGYGAEQSFKYINAILDKLSKKLRAVETSSR